MKKMQLLVVSCLAVSLCFGFSKGHRHSHSKHRKMETKPIQKPTPKVKKPLKQEERDTQVYTVTQLSEAPRIFHLENFLSQEECDYIIKLAKPEIQQAQNEVILTAGKDKILTRIEKRIARATQTPVTKGDVFCVTHCKDKQQDHLHFDYVWKTPEAVLEKPDESIKASMIIYLYDTEEGGETIFPYAGKSIAPVKGSAILYYSLLPSGECDPKSLLGTAPVLKGEKWTIIKRIR